MTEWPADHVGHWWSGWPGAFCMRCGADDFLERAVGEGWYDPYTNKWDTEEHQKEFEASKVCPADALSSDPHNGPEGKW